MKTSTGIGIALLVAAIGGGAVYFYRRHKKKKESSETSADTGKGSNKSSGSGSVYSGLTGPQTVLLQTALNTMRQMFVAEPAKQTDKEKKFLKSFSSDLKVDGVYGNGTLTAVKALQTYLNDQGAKLKVDGKYGKDTEKAFTTVKGNAALNTKIIGA